MATKGILFQTRRGEEVLTVDLDALSRPARRIAEAIDCVIQNREGSALWFQYRRDDGKLGEKPVFWDAHTGRTPEEYFEKWARRLDIMRWDQRSRLRNSAGLIGSGAMTRTSIFLDEETRATLDRVARETGQSMSELIRQAVAGQFGE